MAENGGRRHRVQRVRALPEDPQPAEADHVEEGQRADEEAEAEQGGELLLPPAVPLLREDGGDDDGVGLDQLRHLCRLLLVLLQRLLVPVPTKLDGLLPSLVLLAVLLGEPRCLANVRHHGHLLNLSINNLMISCYCCISSNGCDMLIIYPQCSYILK